MPWISRLLRGQRVWVRTDEQGKLAAVPGGRVDVRYRRGGKIYNASLRNLAPDPSPSTWTDEEAGRVPPTAADPPPAAAATPSAPPATGDAVIVYTDGACTGNPGPAGIGVVILDGAARRELSEPLGHGTNNIAELTAIIRALEETPRDRPVRVHTDSSYAHGLLCLGWKPKANHALVDRMRQLAREFADLRLIKVDGHAGVAENERADQLARAAVRRP